MSAVLIMYSFNSWDERNSFGSMFGMISSLFSGLALIGIVYSIYLQIVSIEADHDRRKKQATLEYINSISPVYRDMKNMIVSQFGNDVLTKENVSVILNDPEKKISVMDYLNGLEHLCVGVNSNVFDKEIFYRMSGTRIIKTLDIFNIYIQEIQRQNPTAYSEFTHLAMEFSNRRRSNISNKGTIE